MLYVGLDAHQRFYQLAFLREGQNTPRPLKVRGTVKTLIDRLRREAQGERLAICFEASCDYGHLHDHLCQVADRVVVAHPGALRLIYGSKRKHDKLDAAKLAKLLALDMVPDVWVPPGKVRSWRRLIQHRRWQVDQRTACKDQLKAMLRTHGLKAPKNCWAQCRRSWWHEQNWPRAEDAWQAEDLLMQLDHLEDMVHRATERLDQIGQSQPGVALLRTIPGIGPRTAEALVAWIDKPQRFASGKKVAAYFGLVPRQDQSGDRNHLGHITKEGPAVVRQLLVEAAWNAVRLDPAIRAVFERLVNGDKDRRKTAITGIARRLLVMALKMLKTGETYRAPTSDEGSSAVA